MHVLVTDDSYKHTLGIVRCLGKKGIRVSVLADSPTALASLSRYCSAKHVVPPPSDRSFATAIIDLLRRVYFDLVIPVGYTSTVALAEHQEEIRTLTRMEVVSSEKIRQAADKTYMHGLATAAGVPVPRMISPASFDEAVQRSTELQFPVVIKSPCETPKEPVRYAQTRSELLSLYRVICERIDHSHRRLPMIQEFVPGFGCGFFALYQEGVCKRVYMHKRIRETPPSGGVSCCAESFYDAKLKDYGMRLLDRLGWHGVAMVEFRCDERDGKYKLMEINPKFWGSLDLALAAGVEFPYYLCQTAQGERLEYSEEYERSLRYHWPLLEMQHVLMRPASLGAVLTDSLDSRVKSNISWRDFKPNLLEPFARMRTLLSRVRLARNGGCGSHPAYRPIERVEK